MKKRWRTILISILFLTGLTIILYPIVSNWSTGQEQKQVIDQYVEAVENMKEEDYTMLWEEAEKYNQALLSKTNRYHLTEEDKSVYMSLLNISGNGVMGYLEIEKIKLRIPIYHGTDETVLQVAVGHIAGSSLPVGGKSTHCVLSGHRGLPTARLFTDLDKLQEGDLFMIKILNQTITYQVDSIFITEPDDISVMEITPGQDYCTLMTCTPYGINTHRLFIRGQRI